MMAHVIKNVIQQSYDCLVVSKSLHKAKFQVFTTNKLTKRTKSITLLHFLYIYWEACANDVIWLPDVPHVPTPILNMETKTNK